MSQSAPNETASVAARCPISCNCWASTLREAGRAAPILATVRSRRDRAILEMMLLLRLRAEEVAKLLLDTFRQDSGRWWLRVTGKGRKTRRLKLHDEAFASLSAWLEASGSKLGEEGPVFVSVNKGDNIRGRDGISSSVVSRLVAEYGQAAGLAPLHGTNRLSPHDLRRTAARNAFDNGANLLQVQAMLGHADRIPPRNASAPSSGTRTPRWIM